MGLLRLAAIALTCAVCIPLMRGIEIALRWPLTTAVLIVAAAVFASSVLGAESSCVPGLTT